MGNLIFHSDDHGLGFTKILAATGCDVTDERHLSFGMMAYNTAMLVWQSYESQFRPTNFISRTQPNKVGRNDPCPCESGQKYKRCCLAKESDSQQVTSQNSDISFGPDLIPKIWDEKTAYDDMVTLDQLLRNEPNLKKLRYESEFSADLDSNAKDQYIDKLAVQFAETSGEGKILEKATDLMLAAAKNVKTAKEFRALASGVIFAAAYEASGEVDSPLTALIFRLSVTKVLEPISAIKKIAQRLESKINLGDIDDSQRLLVMTDLLQGLNKKERNAIQKIAEDIQEDISKCLSEGKFPMGLPFATTFPFWLRVCQLHEEGVMPEKDEALSKIVREFGETLVDDDYRLFLADLQSWLDENEERQDLVSDSVKMMHLLAKTKSLAMLMPDLLFETCRQDLFAYIDEEEIKMVDEWRGVPSYDEILEYANFLQSKGYPQIADRTRSLIQHH